MTKDQLKAGASRVAEWIKAHPTISAALAGYVAGFLTRWIWF